MSLSSTRELTAENIKTSQKRYKQQYDKRATSIHFKAGGFVLVRFPHKESGKNIASAKPLLG